MYSQVKAKYIYVLPIKGYIYVLPSQGVHICTPKLSNALFSTFNKLHSSRTHMHVAGNAIKHLKKW